MTTQLPTSIRTILEQNAQMSAQLSKLTSLIERQDPKSVGQINNGTITVGQVGNSTNNITQVDNSVTQVDNSVTRVDNSVTQVINIIPWDDEGRIRITTSTIAAAFRENKRLAEYSSLDADLLTDPEIAPPYVTELLVDLVRRAHADPSARNIYLNPNRADQALAQLRDGAWIVAPLAEATHLLLEGVAVSVRRVTLSAKEREPLPLEAQNALAMAGLMYQGEPEAYIERAKSSIAAHLANTRPNGVAAPKLVK